MNNSPNSPRLGPQLLGVLLFGLVGTAVLASLRYQGHIQWRWWWLTAPLWGPWALAVAVLVVVLLVALLRLPFRRR